MTQFPFLKIFFFGPGPARPGVEPPSIDRIERIDDSVELGACLVEVEVSLPCDALGCLLLVCCYLLVSCPFPFQCPF